jgi:hypothetical protein
LTVSVNIIYKLKIMEVDENNVLPWDNELQHEEHEPQEQVP